MLEFQLVAGLIVPPMKTGITYMPVVSKLLIQMEMEEREERKRMQELREQERRQEEERERLLEQKQVTLASRQLFRHPPMRTR